MKWIMIVLFLFLFQDPSGLNTGPGKMVVKEIQKVFKKEDFNYKTLKIPAELNDKLPSKITDQNFFEIHTDNQLLGYAYIDQAPSKSSQFDYLILFDKNLIIVESKVLIYREGHGGEIGSKRWLRQFTGKKPGDDLDDIAAISGATISVRSMKTAVANILSSLQILQNKNILP